MNEQDRKPLDETSSKVELNTQHDESPQLSRRALLGSMGGAAAATAALGAGSSILPGLVGGNSASAAIVPGNQTPAQRHDTAYRLRVQCARTLHNLPLVPHIVNGDDTLYPDRIASFTKGMPHNSFGEVDLPAYDLYLAALASGRPSDFEAIPHGCPTVAQRFKFDNPQAGLAFDLQGPDGHQSTMRPAPAFASAEEASEIVENYWMSLLRDVPFTEYGTSSIAADACADLTSMSDFRAPKNLGVVTPQLLFRDNSPGALSGPYISQFLYHSQPFGAQFVDPRMRTVAPFVNFLTTETDWLDRQNGFLPTTGTVWEPLLRYIRNGRDLAQWVHIDVLYQAYFQAALALGVPPDPGNPHTGGGYGCPLNPGNPYLSSQNQRGFVTFGGPYIMTLLTEVATRALHATWFQKWFVHRRLRPEAFGGAIHHKIANGRPYSIHNDVLNSVALARTFSQNGTYFLPQAFPEGCPTHPAYAAGHATVAGACVTLLKALFSENHPITDPVVPSADGLSLVPYTGPGAGSMTVGGELNKLAMNVAFGRNMGGVHWRTDGGESMRLGEDVAISLMIDQRLTYTENFNGFTFTRFNGQTVTV